ncbi:NAD(P)/FAD-dependent oxidoreductase [Heyndrickxia acidiproducens]|uniref:NAD(P)/FAD-dependent oxidoreductase n=1 Tax=Heyndrickxia acidiproducens TaxID=1121084 RepID=UPI000362E5C1|nr:NAD(P)/FAD-dependent oxidoreductase [Heyndrickxia acidiproducens]
MEHIDVLIIGGGPAGISATIWCKRLGLDHLLIEEHESLGGQLSMIRNKIIDYPGFIEKDGEELRQHFLNHLQALQCHVKTGMKVLAIDAEKRTVTVQQGPAAKTIHFQFLIAAAGSSPKRLGVPGEEEMLARGETYTASRDSHLFRDKTVAVVGGGDRAFEGAMMLADSGAQVYLINRSNHFKARSQYVEQAVVKENITILNETRVLDIEGDQKVEAVNLVKNTGEVRHLPVSAVFIRIGAKPNTSLFPQSVNIDEEGYIQTDAAGKTSCDCIYAAGDNCSGSLFSSIAGAAGQGATAAKHIAFLLTGKRQYAY